MSIARLTMCSYRDYTKEIYCCSYTTRIRFQGRPVFVRLPLSFCSDKATVSTFDQWFIPPNR